MLASLPEPAPQSVGDGGYFTQLERYLADREGNSTQLAVTASRV